MIRTPCRRLNPALLVSTWTMALAAALWPAAGASAGACEQVLPKLIASDGAAGDILGVSVSISDDTAIVGAYLDDASLSDSGSAYVFVRSGPPGPPTEAWTEQQKLTASDGAADDRFGWSVSISGDTAIVGAHLDDDFGSSSGSAYVFVRSGTFWTQQQKLTASDGAANDEFGRAVSINGDTAIVGSRLDDAPAADSGSAYVFVRSGTVWTQQQKLTASDGAALDEFGYSVSISGDMAIVGAWGDDDLDNASGSAYVFVRSGIVWTQQQKLTASDGAADDQFGASVSISGDTAIVGAYRNDAPAIDSGSAYVFVRSGPPAVWTQQQKLTASDGAADDRFSSVSISGDTAIVGAHADDDLGTRSGSAYVFTRSGTVWIQQQKLTASDGAAFDNFGLSVSISGDIAIVGAYGDNSGTGSAYVFECPSDPPSLADIDGDGDVDIDDLFTVIAAWGPCPRPCPPTGGCEADIDDDCDVDIDDLFAVIAAWGP